MCRGLNPQYKTQKLKCFHSTQKEACHVGQLDIYNHASHFFFLDSYSVKNIIVFVQIFPFVFLLIFKAVNIVSWVNKVDAPAFL